MALALARTLISSGAYDQNAVANAYAEWFDSHPFDIGQATRAALGAASRGRSEGRAASCALKAADPLTQANGALMRISPLGIFGANLPSGQLMGWARADALLTHPNPVCLDSSAIFAAAIAWAIRTGRGARATYEHALETARTERIAEPVAARLEAGAESPPADFVRQQGWVLTAFQNAFYQLLHAESFEEGVVQTVRAGGDTDTNGAIAGALLGAVHGGRAVPKQWKDRMFKCRPMAGLPGVARPRPERYWPVDALTVAERLLSAGSALNFTKS